MISSKDKCLALRNFMSKNLTKRLLSYVLYVFLREETGFNDDDPGKLGKTDARPPNRSQTEDLPITLRGTQRVIGACRNLSPITLRDPMLMSFWRHVFWRGCRKRLTYVSATSAEVHLSATSLCAFQLQLIAGGLCVLLVVIITFLVGKRVFCPFRKPRLDHITKNVPHSSHL